MLLSKNTMEMLEDKSNTDVLKDMTFAHELLQCKSI